MSFAQRIFYCDSIVSTSHSTLMSECKVFYNLSTNQLDSVQKLDLELGAVFALPVRIIAPINNRNEINGVVFGLSKSDTIFKIDYSHGLAHGYYIRYCKKDTLSITQYKNGKKDGIEVVKLICKDPDYIKTFYRENIEVGPCVFMKNNRISSLTSLKEGKKDGAEYNFYDDGSLEWYLVYKSDKVIDGSYYRFDPFGNIVEIQTYKHGKLRKSVKYYDDASSKVTKYK
jgi:antitoxin component YwqK of YwqJK toxin-antitoxin module